MIVCWDASAAVKLLRAEPGSDLASTLWQSRRPFVASALILPEVASALARVELEPAAGAKVRTQWDRVVDRLDLVALDDRRAQRAGDLVETHRLRGADAVHLATALDVADLGAEVVLATWDRRLHAAAVRARLAVAPAEL